MKKAFLWRKGFVALVILSALVCLQLIPATAAARATTITISAAGDCTFGSDRITSASVNFDAVYRRQKKPSYFFKRVKRFFQRDDLSIVNFEGTLTKRSTRADKKYAFKGDPSYVNILRKGSIEAVAFANNHCRDFGEGSYVDTADCFKKNGIVYSSGSKVGIYKAKGKKIGMISVNVLEGAGLARQLIQKGMKKLREKKADLFIVSMHAGVEYQVTPSAQQREIARYAIDQGANLVLGHHPHILQGVEKYKGSYIVYSLGNFCFGGNSNPSDKDTMIFRQTFVFRKGRLKKKEGRAQIIPCSLSSASGINDYQPTPATGGKRTRIVKKINQMCRPFRLAVRDKDGVLIPD